MPETRNPALERGDRGTQDQPGSWIDPETKATPANPQGPTEPPARAVCVKWRPFRRGTTLRGFLDLELASGLIILDLAVHQNGPSRWVQVPGIPVLDGERRQLTGQDGKPAYKPTLTFKSNRVRQRFSHEALAALEAAGVMAFDEPEPEVAP